MAARAVVSTTPALAEVLAADWKRAAGFYAHFGVTEAQFRFGISALSTVHRLEQERATDNLVYRLSGCGGEVERSLGH